MLSEDANDKTVNLVVRVSKLSGRALLNAIKLILAEIKKDSKMPSDKKVKHGRTTLKQLSQKNDGLSTFELKSPDLRLLNRCMKKHGVDFAVAKDGKGKYTLFFKGKDVDAVTHAFEKYAKTVIKRDKGWPSITERFEAAKDMAKTLSKNKGKEKNRNRGGLER